MIVEHNKVLDTTDLICPEPVMMLHAEIRKIESKSILKVVATDPSTKRDIPKFCQFLGHRLVKQAESKGNYFYWIAKK